MKSVQSEVKDFTAISSMKIQRKLTYFRKKSQAVKSEKDIVSNFDLYIIQQNEKKLATSKVVTTKKLGVRSRLCCQKSRNEQNENKYFSDVFL